MPYFGYPDEASYLRSVEEEQAMQEADRRTDAEIAQSEKEDAEADILEQQRILRDENYWLPEGWFDPYF